MVLNLGSMCQCELHAMLWSHIGINIRFLAAESRTTAGPLFLSQCRCGTILLTVVFDGVGLAGFKSWAYVFLLAKAALSLFLFYYSSLSLLSVNRLVSWSWRLGNDRVYTLSLSLVMLTSFNNNKQFYWI